MPTIQIPVCMPNQVSNVGCVPEGQLVTDIICPLQNLPICYCSPSEACPIGTSCFHGVCCSSKF